MSKSKETKITRKATGGQFVERKPSRAGKYVPAKRAGRGEIWIVQIDGRSEEVVTTPTSAAVMDKAKRTYSRALKNLAKK